MRERHRSQTSDSFTIGWKVVLMSANMISLRRLCGARLTSGLRHVAPTVFEWMMPLLRSRTKHRLSVRCAEPPDLSKAFPGSVLDTVSREHFGWTQQSRYPYARPFNHWDGQLFPYDRIAHVRYATYWELPHEPGQLTSTSAIPSLANLQRAQIANALSERWKARLCRRWNSEFGGLFESAVVGGSTQDSRGIIHR
jgi:hypothetical protein